MAINWHEVMEYREGKLYWTVNIGRRIKVGQVVGPSTLGRYPKFKYQRAMWSQHRVIWEMFNGPIPPDFQIDHINQVTRDNRIENLRVVTKSQNMLNRSRKKGVSKYFGVYFRSDCPERPWSASLYLNNKQYPLGFFKTEENAAQAYNFAAHDLHGTFAKQNKDTT